MPTPVADLLKSPVMTLSLGRREASGWRLLPSTMSAPEPLADQFGGLMPLPMKSAAKRLGGVAAGAACAPQTGSDSSHGKATEQPTPVRKVRRERWEESMGLSS